MIEQIVTFAQHMPAEMTEAIRHTQVSVQSGGQSWGGFGLVLGCMGILFGLVVFIFWLWALIDVVRHDFPNYDKIVWLLVVVLLNWLGALLYLFIGRHRRLTGPTSSSQPFDGA